MSWRVKELLGFSRHKNCDLDGIDMLCELTVYFSKASW